jgi:fibronectin-binding autotransporter adhesin
MKKPCSIPGGVVVMAFITTTLGLACTSIGLADVTTSGSIQDDGTNYFVGYIADGTLSIDLGSLLSRSKGYLGYNVGCTGTATVIGTGSKWTNSHYLYAGYDGIGTLNIQAGGQVSNYDGYLGYNSGSTGTATVTGTGSTWNSGILLAVGDSDDGTLNIEAGGQVSNYRGYLGSTEYGSTGTATISGTGSTWINSGDLSVGGYYGSGTLTVSDGGLVTTKTLYASLSDLFGNGTITVKGAVLDADVVFDGTHGPTPALAFGTGGTLNLNMTGTGSLGVGYKGTGTLRIADGLTIASSFGYLSYYSSSTGTATVTGTGSKWTNNGDLYIGLRGSGTLNIEAGGQVSTPTGYLGYNSGSTGIAMVTGTGSNWNNSSTFYVGEYGTGIVYIGSSWQVCNSDGYLGHYSGSVGIAVLNDINSKWTNSSVLFIGDWGNGTLDIEAGEQICNNSYLGRNPGSTGTVYLNGSGSRWTNNGNLYIGFAGTGTLSMYDSVLDVKNGKIQIGGGESGEFDITSGLVIADEISKMPNSVFSGNGGMIRVNRLTGFNSFSFSGDVYLGHTGGSGTGTMVISKTDSFSVVNLIIGDSAPAVFTQSGGSVLINDSLVLGSQPSASGTYILSGGTLKLSNIQQGAGSADFNFGGGTLQTNASFSTNMPITLTGTGGNANVDTTGHNITLAGALSGQGGLHKLGAGSLEITAAPSYLGNTSVTEGTLKYNIATGVGNPAINALAMLTIGSGSSVIAGGDIDSFTDSADPTKHVSIINDSAIEILGGPKSIGALTGNGMTTLDTGAQLSANRIFQNTLIMSGNSKLTIRPYGVGSGDLGADYVGGEQNQVPEPGAISLLIIGGIFIAVFSRRRR